MKYIYIWMLLLLTLQLPAQNISGRIVSNDDEPMPYINAGLESTKFLTKTDEYGFFEFHNLQKGSYVITVSALGHDALSEKAELTDNNLDLSLKLNRITNSLEEVLINCPVHRKDKGSCYAARLPLKNIGNPQVINVVTNDLLQEQVATDYNTALRNAPGITKGWSSANGHYSSRRFNTRVSMRNGVTAYSSADLDIVNVEQLQVIKGFNQLT
jgi:iron complex outermembrane recepter protein